LERFAAALRSARAEGRPSVVPYLMVDRRRAPRLAAVVNALARGGASALELGFPFSDPIADGPTLEGAAGKALQHHTGWTDLLEQVRVASQILPTAVMTYANPVWNRGLRPAMAELHRAGAGGLIVPDLSFEEAGPWMRAARSTGLSLVLFAAPAISPRRVEQIARHSAGFLYLVSRYGTTGRNSPAVSSDLAPLVEAAHHAAPGLPVIVGFGVRDRATAQRALSSGADGVIVGSALEELLQDDPSAGALERFVHEIAVAKARRRTRSSARPGARL
jgi:tryptophan synthase alpha chain